VVLSGDRVASALRFSVSLHDHGSDRAACGRAGDFGRGKGDPDLSCRRNGDGDIQDAGRLLDYPEPNFFRVGGVPLFSGFMYACIGSYLCRAWRLFDFEFSRHPRRLGLVVLSVAIYLNFFSHHFMPDLRWLLFALAGWLFLRTRVYFRVWHISRSMPLLLGLMLVSLFIWFSENIGTFTKIWLYPSQRQGWSMVSIDKFGSWFLLLIISYTLVSLVHAPRDRRVDQCTIAVRKKFNRMPDFWRPRP
jgi:hypothetical protein